MEFDRPQSRNEAILQNMLGASNLLEPPQSRVEALLQKIAEQMPEANPSEGTATGTLDRLKIGDEIYSVEGGGGIRPIGVTTTPLYDGATTNPIQINGESYTAETGDMVTYQSTEFLFNVNEVWQELGDVSVVLAIIDDIFADIAPAFDATSTYAVGDYVIYNDQLYKCTTAHTGTWASADFTATSLSDEIKNKQNTLTAGKYINIDENNEIKVNPVVPNEAFTYRIYGNNGHNTVEKIVDGVVVHRENHESGEFDPPIIYDDAIKITYYNAGAMKYELLIPSDTHEVGYVQTWAWWNNVDFTETFSTVDHTGEKLVIKSELDAALADKQDALTAGKYINIDANNKISVDPVVPNEAFTYTFKTVDDNSVEIIKTVEDVVVFDEVYSCWDPVTQQSTNVNETFDNAINIHVYTSGERSYTLLIASDTHEAGFKQTTPWYQRNTFVETFSTVDHTGEKLITKSDMDAALADKQDNLTAGNYIQFEDDEISVKRLVLDGDEYTYDIYSKSTQDHVVVDKYDSNGTLVSTREYYMNDLNPAVEVDGLFTLYAYGGPWTCTLLVASKDHAAGYSFSCQFNVYTHYPETFELPPEESPNDLIIREELNAVKSGLTNYQTQNDLNLEVPNRKNLFNPNSTLQLGFSNSAGTNGTFTSGSYYAYVVKKRSVSSFTISGADFTKIDDASIRVFTSSDYPAIGVSEWRGSNISASTSKTVTLSENDQYLTFLIKWEDTATQADKEAIMVEEGSTATTFAPYIPSVESRIEAVESGVTNLNIHRNFTSDTIANTITELIAYVRDNLASGGSYKIDGVFTVNQVDDVYVAIMAKASTKVYGMLNYGDKLYAINYVAGTYKNIMEFSGTKIS